MQHVDENGMADTTIHCLQGLFPPFLYFLVPMLTKMSHRTYLSLPPLTFLLAQKQWVHRNMNHISESLIARMLIMPRCHVGILTAAAKLFRRAPAKKEVESAECMVTSLGMYSKTQQHENVNAI